MDHIVLRCRGCRSVKTYAAPHARVHPDGVDAGPLPCLACGVDTCREVLGRFRQAKPRLRAAARRAKEQARQDLVDAALALSGYITHAGSVGVDHPCAAALRDRVGRYHCAVSSGMDPDSVEVLMAWEQHTKAKRALRRAERGTGD